MLKSRIEGVENLKEKVIFFQPLFLRLYLLHNNVCKVSKFLEY